MEANTLRRVAEVRDRWGLDALHVVRRQPARAGGRATPIPAKAGIPHLDVIARSAEAIHAPRTASHSLMDSFAARTPLAVTGLVVACMMLLSSCSMVSTLLGPSAQRKCRRAEGHIAKAVRICPEAAQLKHDTLHVTLPGDSASGSSAMRQEDIDSVAAACEQLREALEAERQLADIINNGNAALLIDQQRMLDSLLKLPHPDLLTGKARKGALTILRQQLCPFEPIHDSTALHDLRISWSASGVLYTIRDFPREVDVPTTTQEIKSGEVHAECDIPKALMALCVLLGAVAAVAILIAISERRMRKLGKPAQ